MDDLKKGIKNAYYIKNLLNIKDEHLNDKHVETIGNIMNVDIHFTQGYHTYPKC